MLNVAASISLHHPGTHRHMKAAPDQNTHMHTVKKTMLCTLPTWKAHWRGWMRAAGLISNQGSWVCSMEIPSTNIAAEVDDWMRVFQLFKLFFYLLSSKLKTQVADSLVYDPLVPHHPPHSSDTFSNKWNLRRFSHFGGNWRMKIWSHLRLLAAHLLASFKTASTEHYILFLLTLLKVQHLFLLHCMITIQVLSHSVLCSSAWLCLGWRRRSDLGVRSCASV